MEVSDYFQTRLKSLEEFSIVGEVRGIGLMSCIECNVDTQNKNSLAIDTKVGERIDKHCQNLGLLLRPIINMCILSPPLIINKTQKMIYKLYIQDMIYGQKVKRIRQHTSRHRSKKIKS